MKHLETAISEYDAILQTAQKAFDSGNIEKARSLLKRVEIQSIKARELFSKAVAKESWKAQFK